MTLMLILVPMILAPILAVVPLAILGSTEARCAAAIAVIVVSNPPTTILDPDGSRAAAYAAACAAAIVRHETDGLDIAPKRTHKPLRSRATGYHAALAFGRLAESLRPTRPTLSALDRAARGRARARRSLASDAPPSEPRKARQPRRRA